MIIINARIFDGRKFIKENSVAAENGLIAGVLSLKNAAAARNKYPGHEVIDAKGLILSPGLVDIHTHGAGNINSVEVKSREDVETISRGMAKTGTTSCALASAYSYFEKEHLNIISGAIEGLPGARIHGIYLESPFVSMEKKGMIPDQYVAKKDDSYRALMADVEKNCPALKVITIAPEVPHAARIIKEYVNKGVLVSFGHSTAGYEETLAAIKAGARNATHFFNAMNPLHHRAPGPLPAVLENKEVMIELVADGNHVHPAVIKMAVELFGTDRIMLVTDSMGTEFKKEGWHDNARYGRVLVKDGGIYGEKGNLIGSTVTLLEMAGRVRKWCSLSTEDTLRMVTSNPAKQLGVKCGVLKKGYYADLILINGDLNLKKVIINRKIKP